MAIVAQNTFDKYSYKYETAGSYNITIANAGYIQLIDNDIESNRLNGCYTKIEFGDDVTCIGVNCCKAENQLTSVLFSNKLTEIQEFAFASCTNLISVDLPNSLINICPYCFYNSYNLSSTNIPNKITDIPYRCFGYCNLGPAITIPSNITCIQEEAFIANWNIEQLDLNNGLKVIDDFAFIACQLTGNLSIPNTVEYIGTGAFAYTTISSVNIPINTKIPTGNPFCGCYCLSTPNAISIDIANATHLKKGGHYGIMNEDNILVVPCDLPGEGEQIYSIGEYCFSDTNLTSISFDEDCLSTVSAINDYAFQWTDLQNVKLTNSIKSIGEGAFYCNYLNEIDIPSTLTELKNYTFCTNSLSSIAIHNYSVSSIGDECFAGNPNLKTIIFYGDCAGKTIPTLGDDVFDNNTSMIVYVADTSISHQFMEDPKWVRYVEMFKVIPTSNDLSDATVLHIPDQTFSFEAHTPEITVLFGPDVIENNYLDIQYSNNIDVGRATVTITAKPDSPYIGTKVAGFDIVPADIRDSDATVNE